MAKKLDQKELNNVSGGNCKSRFKCSNCKKYYNDYSWLAKSPEYPNGTFYCPKCAEELKKDPKYYDWEQK